MDGAPANGGPTLSDYAAVEAARVAAATGLGYVTPGEGGASPARRVLPGEDSVMEEEEEEGSSADVLSPGERVWVGLGWGGVGWAPAPRACVPALSARLSSLRRRPPPLRHNASSAGALASQLGIPRAAAARNASYYGSDAETLSSRDWSDGGCGRLVWWWGWCGGGGGGGAGFSC